MNGKLRPAELVLAVGGRLIGGRKPLKVYFVIGTMLPVNVPAPVNPSAVGKALGLAASSPAATSMPLTRNFEIPGGYPCAVNTYKGRLRSAVLRLTPVPRDHAVRTRWPGAEVLLLVDVVDAAEHCTTCCMPCLVTTSSPPPKLRCSVNSSSAPRLPRPAEHQQVRVSTMRSHMAHLLAKTGTRRQSDLMRLLS